MQICSHCGTENLEGVMFCQKCGIALGPVAISTRRFEGDEPVQIDSLGPEGVIILQVGNDATPILLQLKQEVVLGRVTEPSDTTTYINLTPYGAEEAGVSRRHARLLRDGRAVLLMDLNSRNGTHLNGELMPPSVEKRVRDGDEILLGRLKVYVFFKT